jgi:hypothetical protein
MQRPGPREVAQCRNPAQKANAGASGQPSSAIRPISVILIRTISIPVTTSRSAVASPAWTRPAIMLRSNPCTSASWSSVTPCRTLSSSASAWRCSLLRLGSRGGTAIRAELTESFAANGRRGDTKLKNRTERAISLSSTSKTDPQFRHAAPRSGRLGDGNPRACTFRVCDSALF